MLRVFCGDMEGAVYNASAFFKFNYQPQWLEDPQVRQMILDVDRSRALGSGAIDSPRARRHRPDGALGRGEDARPRLRGSRQGVQRVRLRGNCAQWPLRIGEQGDVTVNLRHIMDFGQGSFSILVENTGDVVHSMAELVPVAGRYV